MRVLRTASELSIWAPAKLNLFLEVLEKRSDGFHEIETLMCPINLCDTIYFRDEPKGQVTLACEFAAGTRDRGSLGADQVPASRENLVVRAVELLRRETGHRWGAHLRLVKRIPAAAGLAGGSSDAAAALVLANAGWNLGLPPAALHRLASTLGSDVPFFLGRGSAVCRGRGERVFPVEQLGGLHVVVVRPPEGLSTADVYRACRPPAVPVSVNPLVAALRRGAWRDVGRLLVNRLQPAASQLCPWIGRLEREFAQLDLIGHQMSGSGTSYFGLCRSARHARQLAARLSARGRGRVYALRTIG